MQSIFAHTALMPDGWRSNVRASIGDDGRISAVDLDAIASADDTRVGVLLAAPANAHSHAFQRAMAGLTEGRGPEGQDSFWTWRQLMYRFLDRLTPEDVEAIATFVQMEMLEAGYGASVEFHYLHHQKDGVPYGNLAEMAERIAAASTVSGMGLTLLPVHYQFGGCDGRPLGAGQLRFGNDLNRFQALFEASSNVMKKLGGDAVIGVAPHSLRAVGQESLRELPAMAPGGPVHMHLAEQIAEVDEVLAHLGQRPVEWLMDHTDLNENWCLIHCTQMTDGETVALAGTGATAGLCPITEASLGDGIFNGVRWFGANGRIAIGSDSNIRISVVEELRQLEYSQRSRDRSRSALASAGMSTGRRLYEAALEGGAKAAGRQAGEISVGMYADLVSLDDQSVHLTSRNGDALLDSWIFAGDSTIVRDTWSAGRHMVQEGAHIEQRSITEAYRKTLARIGASI